MKKSLIFALSIISTTLYAQDNYTLSDFNKENREIIENIAVSNPENLSFGFNISPTISWLNVNHNDLHTDGATLTGQLGFNAEYNINKLLSVVSGLNFGINGGYVYDNASLLDPTTKSNFLMNLYTMEVPFLLRIKTPVFNKTIYYAQTGLLPGFRLSSREFHKASSFNVDNKTSNINNLTNPILLSYSVGFGAKFVSGKNYDLFAEVNLKSSLLNIESKTGYSDDGRYPTPPQIKGGNMIFSFGVMF
jgi:hypothetical protein